MNRKQRKIVNKQIEAAKVLGLMPANILTPTRLAKEASIQPKDDRIMIDVLGESAMKKLKMGLLLGVSQGSDEEAKFIRLEFRNGGSDKDIVLIGKGLTFDMGGNSIKPASNLHQMKFDMLGSGAVLGAFNAAVELDLPINLVVLIPSSENLINGSATKPGDVHTSMSGLTVDIRNCDAEGRLILADALTFAQRFLDPQAIVTVATLTGAQLYATGRTHSALLGNNQDLIDEVHAAGNKAKDLNWNLPFVEEHSEEMKGQEGVSDLKNIADKAGPGTTTAFAFLEAFVDEDVPFAHLDVAATASEGDEVTGRPIASLVQFLIDKAK